MDKTDFFGWCAERGLNSTQQIASAFCVTPQTIRNWRRDEGDVPGWVSLAILAHDGRMPKPSPLSVLEFYEWRCRHGLAKSYDATGAVFGLSRQAIHNWVRRRKFPNYLALACAGVDAAVSRGGSVWEHAVRSA